MPLNKHIALEGLLFNFFKKEILLQILLLDEEHSSPSALTIDILMDTVYNYFYNPIAS